MLQQELEARAANGAAMQEFELAQLRITKEAEIRIAGAQAMAALSGTIHANVFGTPETVARMTETYMKGMGVSTAVEGFFAGAGNDTKELAEGAGSTIAGLLRSVVARLESGDSGQAKAPVAVTATQATPAKTTGVQNNGG